MTMRRALLGAAVHVSTKTGVGMWRIERMIRYTVARLLLTKGQ